MKIPADIEAVLRDLSPDAIELWAERAAIREFDGGQSRDEAERAALHDVFSILEIRSAA